MANLLEERYPNEFKWRDVVENSITENTYDVSAEVSNYNYTIDDQIASLINSASATLQITTDPNKRHAKIDLSSSLANSTLDGIQAYITPEKIHFTMPFIEEWVQVKDDEFGRFMFYFSHDDFEGDEKLGLSNFMKDNPFFSEADQQYLQKEYVNYAYELLPEKAFTSTKENIDIYEKQMKATKISMTLTDQEIKNLFTSLADKALNDKKLHEMLEVNLRENTLLSQYSTEDWDMEFDDFKADFKEELNESIKRIDDLYFEDGFHSTIWTYANSVVKRDIRASLGNNGTTEATLSFTGEQLIDKTNQQWDYRIEVADEYDDYGMDFSGNLTWQDNQATDYLTFTNDDFSITYEGDEQLEKNEREFSRLVRFSDGYDEFGLNWDGDAIHERDSKRVNHSFFVEVEGDTVGINFTDQSKIIKNLEEPEGEIVQIGEMSEEELGDYFFYELYDKFHAWLGSFMFETGLY